MAIAKYRKRQQPEDAWPLLINVNQRGLVFTHDNEECCDWDGVPKAKGGWRQVLVPWVHVLSVAGDQAS